MGKLTAKEAGKIFGGITGALVISLKDQFTKNGMKREQAEAEAKKAAEKVKSDKQFREIIENCIPHFGE